MSDEHTTNTNEIAQPAPNDEYGPVRDRPSDSLEVGRQPKRQRVSPSCPSRSFSSREGRWRHVPFSIGGNDLLGSMKESSESPSSTMMMAIPPEAWGNPSSTTRATTADEETQVRERLEDLNLVGDPSEDGDGIFADAMMDPSDATLASENTPSTTP